MLISSTMITIKVYLLPSYELGDNRLRDDHFSMQHSPTLSDKEIREIYLILQDKYGYNGPMPKNEYYESFRRKINNIIKESLRRKLNEGTTDEEAYNKWEWIKDNVGAEVMVDNLIDWLDSNTIDKIIGWFDEEGYLEGYYDDGMFESKKSKHTINEVGGVMEEWYQEEDYDGNVGEPGMVRSYEPGTLYIHNFEQMAKEEGYKNWKDMFMYWWSEVKYDTPWYWVPEQNCKGGRFLFNAEGDDVEELYEQIVITGRHP